MKRVVAGLVFANVAVFAYLHWIAVPPPVTAPPPPPRPLRLVGEAAPAAPRTTAECRSVGPLKDADVSRDVAAWLASQKRTATERTIEAAAAPNFWVITTRKSPVLAQRLVQQLRAAGVSEVEAVPPEVPDGETRVSLGVYPDRARAERRILDLKGYALSPTIVEQPRRAMQWWLDVEPAPDGAAIDLAALLHAVPAAAGAALAPCVLALPEDEPQSEPPSGAKAPAPATPAPATPAPARPAAPGPRKSGAAT